MFTDKRYQIFVSSTFVDLKEERGKVMETILNFNCFPAGMELFPAMDEEQFQYIKRIIDDSDYYLLIIGGRYGSVDNEGVSWTEKEFDYAVKKGIPVMAFIIEDEAYDKLPRKRTDNRRKKLADFKKRVSTGRLIAKWSNADDLALAVAKSLPKVLKNQPQIGWVRANSVSDDSQKEIENLQKEIADRKKEVKQLKTELEKYKTSLITKETINIIGTSISFKMVHVEGGRFVIGANDDGADYYEKPAHEVVLSNYWIGETQVTQELWQAVMGPSRSRFVYDPNCPVERVSWEDCQKFIRILNRLTKKEFHLPTEAQWEFAARGGNLGKDNNFRYAGSNSIDDVAWFMENSNGKTHPVGTKLPNELGLYDMSGNVSEWCNDWYDDRYYSNSPSVAPSGPESGTKRVIRGGSWLNGALHCRVFTRGACIPTDEYIDVGLRLAL